MSTLEELEGVSEAFAAVLERRAQAHIEELAKRRKRWRCDLGFDLARAKRQAQRARTMVREKRERSGTR